MKRSVWKRASLFCVLSMGCASIATITPVEAEEAQDPLPEALEPDEIQEAAEATHEATSAVEGKSEIRGIVKNKTTGEPIVGALLILQCNSLPGAVETTSNHAGVYRFVDVPAGDCTIQLLSGQANVSKVVRLSANSKSRANFTVDLADKFRRKIVVDANPVNAGAGGQVLRVDMEQAKQMPVGARPSRDFTSVVDLAPTATQDAAGMSLAGTTGASWGAPAAAPQVYPSGEGYAHVAENNIFQTSDDPLSTFSVDVDTASYTNARSYIQGGQLPPPSAVRVEEMINYFSYKAKAPSDPAKPFAVIAEVGPAPWNDKHRLVRLTIKAREIVATKVPPRNLVFLIDVSGSMGQVNKLPLLKSSMLMLVDDLRSQDTVSIVVYAGQVGTLLPPTDGDQKSDIRRAIRSLGAGGSTNGAGGITEAYKLARYKFIKGGVNRVILGTDGDFNVGTSSEAELVRLIERERKSGVFLTVLGFGRGNLQDAKMEALADHGNGNYAYIDTADEAQRVLVQSASGTLVTIAKDVKLQVEFNPSRVKSYRLIGYANRQLATRDFEDDKKDAGEIGAGHSVTALYEVTLQEGPRKDARKLRYQGGRSATKAATSDELLLVNVRHKRPEGRKSRLQRFLVRDKGHSLKQTSSDFRFAAAVAGFGMLLKESKYTGKLNWSMVETLATAARGRDPHGERAEFISLVQQAKRL